MIEIKYWIRENFSFLLTIATWLSIIALLIGIFSIPILRKIVVKYKKKYIIGFIVTVFFGNILISYFMFLSFGGAFGPGVMMSCAYILIILISLILLLLGILKHQTMEISKGNQRLFIIGSLFIIFSQLFPSSIGYYTGRIICNITTETTANTIITAVELYKDDYGDYPSGLNILTPDYLDEIPNPPCMFLNGFEDFTYGAGSDFPVLHTQVPGGGFTQCYEFENQQWSVISFLDGHCPLD